MKPERIISGGQTGADQAGLFAAEELGIPTGGYIPKGCRTDEGPRPDLKDKFGLIETSERGYEPRTWLNVKSSDGTVLFGRMDSPGCKLTIKNCKALSRHYLCNPTPDELALFVEEKNINILNVAGNRERTNPGIFVRVKALIVEAFKK